MLLRLLAGALLAVAAAARATPAQACSLDGIASISMNGTTASLTEGTPSPQEATYWAPFTLLAAAPGNRLRLQEDLGKVRWSLSANLLRTPFRWLFDDGAVARGYAVTHRFARLGWHRLTVEYYYPDRRQWLAFDSAQIDIVPASALLWTNLSYYATQVALYVLRAVVWLGIALVALAMLAEQLPRWRRRIRRRAGADAVLLEESRTPRRAASWLDVRRRR